MENPLGETGFQASAFTVTQGIGILDVPWTTYDVHPVVARAGQRSGSGRQAWTVVRAEQSLDATVSLADEWRQMPWTNLR